MAIRLTRFNQAMHDGLLNQSVDHVWNSEQPLTAIGFVDGFATHRRGPVCPIEKLLLNLGPTRSKPVGEFRDGDAVGAGRILNSTSLAATR